MTAVSSMRLFVVWASPPRSSFSRPSARRITPQPPGPALPQELSAAVASTIPLSISVAAMDVARRVAVALRDGRGYRTPARTLLAPRGRDHPHAVHPLHGAYDVHAAHDRPPARARLLHEVEALQPQRAL